MLGYAVDEGLHNVQTFLLCLIMGNFKDGISIEKG
jgi:hypothetical protein